MLLDDVSLKLRILKTAHQNDLHCTQHYLRIPYKVKVYFLFCIFSMVTLLLLFQLQKTILEVEKEPGELRDPFKPSLWRIMTTVNDSDIFGNFFDLKFLVLENIIPQMSLSVMYQTCASLIWSTRCTQQRINTC